MKALVCDLYGVYASGNTMEYWSTSFRISSANSPGFKALFRLYYGWFKALLRSTSFRISSANSPGFRALFRLYYGSITALLRLY